MVTISEHSIPTIEESDLSEETRADPESTGITREALERELADSIEHLKVLRLEYSRTERIIESLKQLIEAKYTNVPTSGPQPVSLFDSLTAPGRQRFAGMSIKDAIKTVLTEHRTPMKVREIYEALETNGKHVGGKSPSETVRAVMTRYDKFFERVNGKWTLKG